MRVSCFRNFSHASRIAATVPGTFTTAGPLPSKARTFAAGVVAPRPASSGTRDMNSITCGLSMPFR